MVVLKNIIKNEDIKTIEADYFPGGGEIFGHLIINYETEDTIKLERSKNDLSGMFAYHARMRLIKLASLEKIPSESTSIWY